MESYIVINGRRCELTTEKLEMLGFEVKKPNPFEIPKSTKGVDVYCISDTGNICTNHSPSSAYCDDLSKVGNLCADRSLMQQRAYQEILNRLLWRYSVEHALGKDMHERFRLHVYYDRGSARWEVAYAPGSECFYPGYVSFDDENVARNAIKEVVEPFVETHPGFKF